MMYVLLKHKINKNVFWTIFDEKFDHSDYIILFKSDDEKEVMKQWRHHYGLELMKQIYDDTSKYDKYRYFVEFVGDAEK